MKKLVVPVLVLILTSVPAWAQCRAPVPDAKSVSNSYAMSGSAATGTSTTFSVAEKGAATIDTTGGGGSPAVGYARVQLNPGASAPSAYLTFQFKVGDVLVGQASVPGMIPQSSGRIYAEVGGAVNTGVAIANPNATAATISYYYTDIAGNNSATFQYTLAANSQFSKFLTEAPFNAGVSMRGTMTFSSNVPVGVIALRGYTNERGEFLITTLPVSTLSATGSGTVYMPHFADGGGWKTQVVLTNPTDSQISGAVQFYSKGDASTAGAPLNIYVDGQVAANFTYTIQPRSSIRLTTSGVGNAIATGSIRIVPGIGNAAPQGLAIFTFRNNGVTVSEAGVPAVDASTAFRMYEYDCGDYKGQIQTGVAITNPGTAAANVNITLTDLAGASTGLSANIVVPAGGQVAKFMRELIPDLPYPFHGVARISTTSSAGIAVTALRGDYNSRGDFLITTALPTNENAAMSSSEIVFPHLVDRGGYTTEFVLYSGVSGQVSSGVLRFYAQDGSLMSITYQ